jgi:hypothetical protein
MLEKNKKFIYRKSMLLITLLSGGCATYLEATALITARNCSGESERNCSTMLLVSVRSVRSSHNSNCLTASIFS